jgi:hypothetical protein
MDWLAPYPVRKGYDHYGGKVFFDEEGKIERITIDGKVSVR